MSGLTPRAASSLVLLIAVMARCSGDDATIDGSGRIELSSLTENDAFPTLIVTPLRPVLDEWRFQFVRTGVMVDVRFSEIVELRFKDDREAVEAAHRWFDRYFGKLPDGHSLQLGLEEREEPGFDIKLEEAYRGVPTSMGVLFQNLGSPECRIVGELCTFVALEGSERRIVSAEQALDAIRRESKSPKLKSRELIPTLTYVARPTAGAVESEWRATPTWRVFDDRRIPLMSVDAWTGNVLDGVCGNAIDR